jgi:hypothetical protein
MCIACAAEGQSAMTTPQINATVIPRFHIIYSSPRFNMAKALTAAAATGLPPRALVLVM